MYFRRFSWKGLAMDLVVAWQGGDYTSTRTPVVASNRAYWNDGKPACPSCTSPSKRLSQPISALNKRRESGVFRIRLDLWLSGGPSSVLEPSAPLQQVEPEPPMHLQGQLCVNKTSRYMCMSSNPTRLSQMAKVRSSRHAGCCPDKRGYRRWS